MPDTFDATGLTVKTAAEITADLVSGLQGIYGADINTDQNSPDGQMIGILTQMGVDIRELIVSINAGFDPDQAIGTILDERVAINNIQRQGGTRTIQPIDITVSSTVTLQGVSGSLTDPTITGFTVQDSSDNQFVLIATHTFTAGTTSANFAAQDIGAVTVPINTITNPVTIVPDVTTINNSSAAITVGQNEETDAQLRTRRQQSVANATTGYLNGLLGVVLQLPGVTEAALYENDTSSTDGNGIPAHAIWLVVAGGTTADIANAIYNQKSYGCDMKGSITFNITTASGALFVAKYDQPVAENLYIEFNIQTTVTGFTFSTATIKANIVANLKYNIGQFAETSGVTLAALAGIAAQGGGGVPIDVKISVDGSTWVDFLNTATLASQWTLDASRISITVIP